MSRIAVPALLGVALGFGASASNAWSSPLMYVLNAGWAWAGVMVVGGICARNALGGMVTALMSAVCANTAYFLGDSWRAGASMPGVVAERTSFASFFPELNFWIIVALILAPGLGAVGVLQRRRDLIGLLAVTVVPVGASVEMVLPRRWGETAAIEETIARWLVWIVSVLVVAWGIQRYVRWRTRKGEQDGMPHLEIARSQVIVTAVLASCSLIVGACYVVFATGMLHPAKLGAGLTDAQNQASVIARVQIMDEGADPDSVIATMTRSYIRE